MKNFLKLVFIILVFTASCSKNEVQMTNPIAVYNQAYQENFNKDNLEEIKKNARNSYVLLDPFEGDVHQSVKVLKSNRNQIGAYISIGTGENYRADFAELKVYLVDKSWDDWPNEFYIKSLESGLIDIMKKRIDKIANWGFDWVEFDNMDWALYEDSKEKYTFNITKEEAISYYQELCDYVHLKGMKCMAKNTVLGAEKFDGVLYESYSDDKNWWDEAGAKSFAEAGKLTIINHYNEIDCDKVYAEYKQKYGDNISFICEDRSLEQYRHFNTD